MVLAATIHYLSKAALVQLLEKLARDNQLYLSAGENLNYHLEPSEASACSSWSFPAVRAVEPLKALLFAARQDVDSPQEDAGEVSQVIVGAKACDLASLKILDHVFLEGDFQDPDYKARRENLLIISGDCTAAKDVCFCTFVGAKPYPEAGYDLNLSPVDAGFVVQTGSDKGKKLIDQYAKLFKPAKDEQLAQRDQNRKDLTDKVNKQIKANGLTFQDRLANLLGEPDVELWDRNASTCVECGACNFICPTCHCFLLSDLEDRQGFKRFRNWDSCQYKNFARVAGGANQRPRRAQRLHTRFEKKFKFFPDRLGQFACTGCGRCVEACLGKIDMREVLKELAR